MVTNNTDKSEVLSVGDLEQGVRLVSAKAQPVFDVDGKRCVLSKGETFSGGSGGGKPSVSLSADSRGHFSITGTINGRSMNFVVDTGATAVAISTQDAERLGVEYPSGQRSAVSTANGVVGA